jgi:hypothetical protein
VAAALEPSAGRTLTKATVDFGDGSAPLTVTDVGGGYLPYDETGHTYANPGSFTVTVTAYDSSGRHSSGTTTVSVAGRPSASLPSTESATNPSHTLTLTGLTQAAGADDVIEGYTVDWGDNRYTSATGTPLAPLTHSYAAATTTTVRVYFITAHGFLATASTNASVT